MNFDLKSARLAMRDVQAEGFRDGAQGIAPTALPEELRAMFAQSQEAVRYKTAEQIKRIEASLAVSEKGVALMSERWGKLTAVIGELPPPILLPLCAIFASLLVILGEAIFLAPVMDGFGISEYYEQRCLAAVIVLVASGAFEISKKLFHRLARHVGVRPATGNESAAERQPQSVWIERAVFLTFVGLTVLSLAFVCVLGWWRAEEMAFAARAMGGAMQNDEWSRFMSDNLPLTRALVVLFALMLPLFVAFAFEWGADKLRLAREWQKTRRALERLPQERERAAKELEARLEKRDCQLKSLEEQQAEWTHAYKQTHELGEKVGAWRLPLWQVLVKIVAVTLLVAALCFVVNLLLSEMTSADWLIVERYLIALCITLGAGGVYAYHALQTWDRPTARQLYIQRATVWRNAARAEEPKRLSPHTAAANAEVVAGEDTVLWPSNSGVATGRKFDTAQAVANNGHGIERRS
jgi:hypothetical protein